jgi:hypothetical protein
MPSATLTFTAATAAQPGDVVTLYVDGNILVTAADPDIGFGCSDIPVTNNTPGGGLGIAFVGFIASSFSVVFA